MATLAAYPAMMRRSRQRLGLRQLPRRVASRRDRPPVPGLEAGDRLPEVDTWERIIEVFRWPNGSGHSS